MRECFSRLIQKNNAICVGLDPILEKMPLEYQSLEPDKAIISFLSEIVKITSKHAAAFKIQKAFLDLYGGPELLKEIIKTTRNLSGGIPIIVDGKFGDIENTMEAYLKNIFDNADADGIVVNPFMGEDIFNSLKKYKDRGIFVLIRTSNKGASFIQDAKVLKEKTLEMPFWEYILKEILQKFNGNNNIIPILSEHASLSNLRKSLPEETIIFYAGVGAQGGDLNKIAPLFNKQKGGVLINSSRAILYPYSSEDKDWRNKVLNSIENLQKKIASIHNISENNEVTPIYNVMENNKMILFLGPSGVGKSYIIQELCKRFPRTYTYVKPYTTRPLRENEIEKIHVDTKKFQEMTKKGKIICPNYLYNNFYGPSKEDIMKAITDGYIPVLDWPVKKVAQIKAELPEIKIMTIYLTPKDLPTLNNRLLQNNRDQNEERYIHAILELIDVKKGIHSESIDRYFENEGSKEKNAVKIHDMITKFYDFKQDAREND